MAWTGFIGLGTNNNGVFTESAASGYARKPFSLSSPTNGRITGTGANVDFATVATNTNWTFNALAFYTAVSGSNLVLVYPLNSQETVQRGANYTVAPGNVVIKISDGVTGSGMPLDTGGARAIAGTLPGFEQTSLTVSLTAFAGGGQTNATLITTTMTRITTVASANDSVKLPPALPGGSYVILVNTSNNPVQVFGSGTDTINSAAAATGVSQPPNSVLTYYSPGAGVWFSEVGQGYSGSFPTNSFKDNIIAFAGGGQASATVIAACQNRVVTIATAGDSVKLPASAGGLQITVSNAHPTNAVSVFPNTGDLINSQAVNTAYSVPAQKTASFNCMGAGVWHTLLSA